MAGHVAQFCLKQEQQLLFYYYYGAIGDGTIP